MSRRSSFPVALVFLCLTGTGCGDDGEGEVEEVLDTAPDTASPDTTDTADTVEPDTADTADTVEPDTTDTADTVEPDTTDTTEPETTPTDCVIDGVTYPTGALDPANVCAACVPATSTSGWTATAGTFTLFDGALDYSAQGWAIASGSSYSASIVDGALELGTTTPSGASTGGQALLWRALPTAMGAPFTFEVDLRLIAASRHNPSDAGAAILASFTPVFGMPAQRSQMIYLETDRIGWADDSASAAVDLADDAFHTVRFSIDSDDLARVTVDGTEVLTRSSFETNGNIAIGDQTNDPNVDGTMRIRAVRLVCP